MSDPDRALRGAALPGRRRIVAVCAATVFLAPASARPHELRGAVVGAGYGGPLGAHASVGYFSGDEGTSELAPLPVFSLTPELSIGTGGGKASLGISAEMLIASVTLKGSVVRSLWHPVGMGTDRTYAGAELDVGILLGKLSVGALFPVDGKGGSGKLTWSLGLRLPLLKERDSEGIAAARHRDRAARRASRLARAKDGQRRLAEVVLHDPDYSLRREAVWRLTDPDLLWEVAARLPSTVAGGARNQLQQDAFEKLCSKADCVDAIVDPERLLLLARDSQYFTLRLAAGRCYREHVPAAPSDPAALLDYDVTQLEDQRVLYDVARLHDSSYAREAAVTRLTDRDLLSSLTREPLPGGVRQAATSRIASLDAQSRVDAAAGTAELASLATTDPSALVRQIAVARLEDQGLLARIAQGDAVAGVREAAVALLDDQELLARIATKDEDAGVSRRAASRVEDRSLLLAITNTKSHGASAAVARLSGSNTPAGLDQISDLEVPAAIAKRHAREDMAVAAVKRIDDETTLRDIAVDGWRHEAQTAAIGKLSDPGYLGEVIMAMGARQPYTVQERTRQEEAFARLCPNVASIAGIGDQAVLGQIARAHPSEAVAEAALAKTRDQQILADVAVHTRHDSIRQAAVEGIDSRVLLAEVHASALSHGFLPLRDQIARRLRRSAPADPESTAAAIRRIHAIDASWPGGEALRLLLATPDDVNQLSDITALAIVAHNTGGQVSAAAAERYCAIADRDLLIRAASGESDQYHPLTLPALDRLARNGDQPALGEVATSASSYWTRGHAVERLHDQSLLARVARNDKDSMIRVKATERLDDPVLLATIAEEVADGAVRDAARRRLDEIQKTKP